MGAWSTTILGNDTSCEVYERFIELYNLGEDRFEITKIVLEEQEENLLYDKTNVWFGLALACWECKALTQDIYIKVKGIVDSGEDLEFNRELDADEKFINDRAKKLNTFIKKISIEKEKPRAIKKPQKLVESIYKPGMCLAYKNADDVYIGIYLISSEHFRNKGEIKFCFLDFESKVSPTLGMFENGKLQGLKKLGAEWRYAEYCGNASILSYEKSEKEGFFTNASTVFTTIGSLKTADIDKWINNLRWGGINLKDPLGIVQSIEKLRLEWKTNLELSDMTLGKLLDKVGLEE